MTTNTLRNKFKVASLKRQRTQLGQCSHVAGQRGVLGFAGLSQHSSAPKGREEQLVLIVDLSV